MKKIFGLSIIQLLFILSASSQVWLHYDTTNSGISDNSITGIAIDASGNKWFGTLNHGVVKFDGTNWTNYYPLPGPPYIKVIATEGDTVWAGGVYGLARYVGGNWTVYNTSNSGLPFNDITAITFDGLGNKWIGTTAGYSGGGLTKFDGTTWTSYNPGNSGITFSIAASIAVDNVNNNIWVGCGGLDTQATHKGLIKFDGITWTYYDRFNSGFPDSSARCIRFDISGNLWVGTGSKGLIKYDGSTWTVYDTSNTTALHDAPYNTFAVFIDNNNKKWVTSLCKLVTYDDANWIAYDTSNTPMPYCSYAGTVAFENNGNVWIVADGVWVIDYATSISGSTALKEGIINIFPNPFSVSSTVFNRFDKDIVLSIFNEMGNKVVDKILSSSFTSLERNNLASGIYFYNATSQEKIIDKGKFIIQ